jgi:beta-galactosidase GanA
MMSVRFCAALVAAVMFAETSRPSESLTEWKPLSFAILEDYDKDQDLADVQKDFTLFRELGLTTWRGSFGWDDYEPARAQYDFRWLHQFADLAARNGITLRHTSPTHRSGQAVTARTRIPGTTRPRASTSGRISSHSLRTHVAPQERRVV